MSAELALDLVPPTPAATPRGPLVALVHGFMGDVDDWDALTRVLAARGHPVIRVALPGHGRSLPALADVMAASPAARVARTAALLADALVRGRDRLAPGEAVCLVGYSLGGRLCVELAATPERLRAAGVEQLVLVSAAAGGLADEVARAERRRLDRARAMAIRTDFRAFLERWYAAALFAASDPAVRARVIARRGEQTPEAMAHVIEALSPGRQAPRLEALRALSHELPVYWFGGGCDRKYMALADQLAATIPALHIGRIPDAGHHPHVDRPAHFAAELCTRCLGLDAAGSA